MTTEATNLSLVEKQLMQLQQLEIIIDREKDVLQKQDPDKLLEITDEKNHLLVAIQTLDQQFEQSILFKQEKSQGLYEEQLSLIEEILLRCKDKNHVNGQIIAQSQLAVERMKTSLLHSHNKSSMTYDSKGKTSGGLSSLDLKA
ncbi:flagella synthesis protein FlgN [Thalassotalea castellviae]|uniref:Flagellar protein FlgN n=1 Tax=Thalassotalea castellviae TaxID=3075612 RepID=A0ABU2ZY94_9GAMM|nr:flagellar protein FlgN [Thalassotalea sp. W431]MDT0602887.1 flagellar protein FlgN [Thalassotalea sp. W431]